MVVLQSIECSYWLKKYECPINLWEIFKSQSKTCKLKQGNTILLLNWQTFSKIIILSVGGAPSGTESTNWKKLSENT